MCYISREDYGVLIVIHQLCIDDQVEFGEVRYFFRLEDGLTLAMVSIYSQPDPVVLEESYGTVWSCTYGGLGSLRVLPVSYIEAVVAVVPFEHGVGRESTRHFVIEKPGLDVGVLSGTLTEEADSDVPEVYDD